MALFTNKKFNRLKNLLRSSNKKDIIDKYKISSELINYLEDTFKNLDKVEFEEDPNAYVFFKEGDYVFSIYDNRKFLSEQIPTWDLYINEDVFEEVNDLHNHSCNYWGKDLLKDWIKKEYSFKITGSVEYDEIDTILSFENQYKTKFKI